jgi:hypothetical protein
VTFQTTTGTLQPFEAFETINLQSYLDICEEVYGIDIPPQTSWINAFYGQLDIAATNVIFPSGTIE